MKRRKLGHLFNEGIFRSKKGSGLKGHSAIINWEDAFIPNFENEDPEEHISPWRLVIVASVFLIIFFGIFVRLFHLQVVKGSESRAMADNNRVQLRLIHAPRGVIYDRNSRVIAENNPGFRINDENYCKGKNSCFITRDQALSMEAKSDPLFATLEIDAIRNYPFAESTSVVVGYVGQITQDELDTLNQKQDKPLHNINPFSAEYFDRYKVGDRIGRAGLEEQYEVMLRGTDGAEVIEIDAQGHKLRTLRKIDPIPGHNLYTSIDVDLQKWSYKALKNSAIKAKSCCGAVVVSDPTTGEILTLASYPTYDSNVFTDPNKNEKVGDYFQDINSPLLNRAISGVYPPGSTFKITSSLAGLVSGKITKDTLIEDTGVMSLGPFKFANWYFTSYGRTEGMVNLVKALQRSNDIYFYRIGEKMGEVELGKVAREIGFGQKSGIDIPGEQAGLIPSDSWKRQTFDQGWYPGDTLHMAIGQGFMLATPLQIQNQTSLIAAHGKMYKPHVVTKITSAGGSTVEQLNPQLIQSDKFKTDFIDTIHKGLSLVPKDGGTAWPFFNFKIPTAGKTGTAEFGDRNNNTHAWYTAYAPEDDPKIVVTSLVEAGGEGSTVASPIVKEIFTWYFNNDKSNIRSLDAVPIASDSAKLGE